VDAAGTAAAGDRGAGPAPAVQPVGSGPEPEPASRLARRLGTFDAVVVGLAAMVGAGIFAVLGPAARAAGSRLLIGLGMAAAVATANATASARLAARYPSSGGTYVYGRLRLGRFWGDLAGWCFVVGKTASCAAMALTAAVYAVPAAPRPVALAVVVMATAVNLAGVERTAQVARVVVALVLAALVLVVVACLSGGAAHASRLALTGPVDGHPPSGLHGVLQAGGLFFFAFAGYARITTLGEEVRDPARTIPRAVALALVGALALYLAVAAAALAATGPAALAASPAPLATAVRAASAGWAVPVVRVGATVASMGVLLSLLAGVSRTVFAMAADGNLPRSLATVDERHRVPRRAELAVGFAVVAIVAGADVRGAIGFSAVTVLTYYAVANASAWTLPGGGRWLRALAGAGAFGCLLLATSLPARSLVAGAGVVAAGAVILVARGRRPLAGPAPAAGGA
jgi:basic amino acid/polyamine antiporter, APA family